MILFLARPWDNVAIKTGSFGPADCLLSEAEGQVSRGIEYSELMRLSQGATRRTLLLHPYPRRENAEGPTRLGFPVRPRDSKEPRTTQERAALKTLQRMNEVLARVQELEEALDDPLNVWPRLRSAWERAQNEADPRMAEIVRQAKEVHPRLKELERRIRRILRRSREKTQLDHVQEMDRASIRWLVRQPGRNVAERAGQSQRILSTVRRENFDTPENRVLHAYTLLAADVAREWLREHPRAKSSNRYSQVETFRTFCRAFARMLDERGVGIARAGIVPNYVLMQDVAYREIYEAWKRLLERQRVLDDLWAWQAETWTDFAVLAVVLALDEMDESELIAQSPIIWRSEATLGRWFEQDRPLAVFWLKETQRVVEVQLRPESPGKLLGLTRAHVSLRITDPSRAELPRRVAVWTPHAMERLDLVQAVKNANNRLLELRRVSAHTNDILRNGLILTPGHGEPETQVANSGPTRVDGIAFDGSGKSLGLGLDALRKFARSEIYREA